jgi:PAS domain S-box-containing protein
MDFEAEQRYRNVVDYAPDGIFLLDAQGRIVLANHAAAQITGYTEQELIGKSLEDTYPPEQRHLYQQRLTDLAARKQIRFERDAVRKDGWHVPVDVLVALLPNGQFQEFMRDISATRRILAEQQRLAAIVEGTPDYVGMALPDGAVLYLNESFKRILAPEWRPLLETPDKIPLSALHTPDAYTKVMDTAIPYAVLHGTWQGESELLDASGKPFPVLQTIIAHLDESGRLKFLSTICRDIAAIKEAQQNITRLNRAYALLSQVNQTIVYEHDIQRLMERICAIAVQEGKFPFAWIGRVQRDGTVEPVAQSGIGTIPEHPTLTGLLNGRDQLIESDLPPQEDFRARARFALHQQGAVIAILNLYAAEASQFSSDETAILQEVSRDIDFALDAINANALQAKAEGQYHQVIEYSPDAIWLSDSAGTILLTNPAMEELSGYSAKELTGHSIDMIYSDQDRPALSQHLEAIKTEKSLSFQQDIVRKDGSSRHIHVSWFLLPDDQILTFARE